MEPIFGDNVTLILRIREILFREAARERVNGTREQRQKLGGVGVCILYTFRDRINRKRDRRSSALRVPKGPSRSLHGNSSESRSAVYCRFC